MRSFSSSRIPGWIKIAGVLLLFVIIGSKACSYNRQLSYVPESLGVWKVLYSEEKSSGFGPGGNETGVIVYELPGPVSEKIIKSGINYFSKLPSAGTNKNWKRIYPKWNETPISQEHQDWFKSTFSDQLEKTPKIDNYLYTYGFGIDIDKSIENEINSTISKNKSYYSNGRTSVIIIAPTINKIFYVYIG